MSEEEDKQQQKQPLIQSYPEDTKIEVPKTQQVNSPPQLQQNFQQGYQSQGYQQNFNQGYQNQQPGHYQQGYQQPQGYYSGTISSGTYPQCPRCGFTGPPVESSGFEAWMLLLILLIFIPGDGFLYF
eukprot:gene9687-1893_t